MLDLLVCFLFVDSLTIASILRWPVAACVARWSAGGELGSVGRQQGWTLKTPLPALNSLLVGELLAFRGGIAALWTNFALQHFCGFFSLTGRSVGKPETAQHQKCTEGGKKADFFRI